MKGTAPELDKGAAGGMHVFRALPGVLETKSQRSKVDHYYTTIGLLVNFGPPRALLLMAAQALGFRSTGREHPLDSRPGPSGVGVAGSAWGYACGVGDDEVGFAASTNSGDKRRRGVHADSRQGRRWHRSRSLFSRFVCWVQFFSGRR